MSMVSPGHITLIVFPLLLWLVGLVLGVCMIVWVFLIRKATREKSLMYFDTHATKYKGHMFWDSPPEIVTDDPNLAKEFGFSKHARYKKLYVKQVSRSEVDEIYYVTRKGTYRGHSVIVIGYVPEAKKYWMGPTFEEYRISSTEMNLVKEMGFKFYDQAFCDKDVPIDEVLDIVDEYDLRFKNGEYL